MDSKNEKSELKTPINGREQAIDLLKSLPSEHRSQLLKRIQNINPQIAADLNIDEFDFFEVVKLPGEVFRKLSYYIEAPIMGLALRHTSKVFQKKVLTHVPKDYAIEAFKYTTKEGMAFQEHTLKAQRRVTFTVKNLIKDGTLKAD